MTHPGVALMVIVGVGLGAFLYYMFAENANNNQHQYGNEGPPPPEPPDSWSTSQDERLRRRKRGSRAASVVEMNCTICLGELADNDCMSLYPCRHEFHKQCIAKWREQGPSETRNTCPNCRVAIFGSSIL